jgi:exonuclease III
MSELRILWWNVDWQSRQTDAQIKKVLGLRPRPEVIALCELQRRSFADWAAALAAKGYEVVDADRPHQSRRLRVLLAVKREFEPQPRKRFKRMWPGTQASALIDVGGAPAEIHAVHIPNGTKNGWAKIDHLRTVRNGLTPKAGAPPQLLFGDLNTPQSEGPHGITTFGQTLAGGWRERPTSSKPFTDDKPFDPKRWDEGERAVLEGLPNDCGMPDVFRLKHPDTFEVTWVPKGLPEDTGRRLDHVFASRELDVVSCKHIHRWRRGEPRLSDHSAVLAVFDV